MKEEEFQAVALQLERYRAMYEALGRQMEILRLSLEEHARAKTTIERYLSLKPDQEVLIPIGGSSFLFAKVGETQRTLVGIGSDVIVEDTAAAAVERLQKRIEEISGATNELGNRMADLEARVAQYEGALRAAEQEMEQQGGAPG